MANINRCVFTGRIVRDCEVRTTASGKEVISFSLAVNRPRKTESGWEDDASFFDFEKFCDDASYFASKLFKGARVCVESRAKQDRFETKNGEKRSKVKFIADAIDVLESAQQEQPAHTDLYGSDIPF